MRALIRIVLVCFAPCLATAAAPHADRDQPKGPRVLLLGKKDKTPTDFSTRQGPQGIIRQIDRFRAKLPDGYKARIVLGKFFNMNYGKHDDVIKLLTPLDANGKPDGVAHHYDTQLEGGRLARGVTYKAGLRHGSETLYGQVRGGGPYARRVVPWVRGKVEGTMKTFFPDGKVMSAATYVGGVLNGLSRSFDRTGFVVRSVEYRKGKRHGTLTEHWPRTKKLRKVIPYKAGKMHGVVRLYHENGKPKRLVRAWEEKFHGIDKQWYEDGTLRKATWWILDEEVGKEKFDRLYRDPPAPATKPAPRAPPASGPGRSARRR